MGKKLEFVFTPTQSTTCTYIHDSRSSLCTRIIQRLGLLYCTGKRQASFTFLWPAVHRLRVSLQRRSRVFPVACWCHIPADRINRECFLLILGCQLPSVCAIILKDRQKKKNWELTYSTGTHPDWASAQLSLTAPSSSHWSESPPTQWYTHTQCQLLTHLCSYHISTAPSTLSNISADVQCKTNHAQKYEAIWCWRWASSNMSKFSCLRPELVMNLKHFTFPFVFQCMQYSIVSTVYSCFGIWIHATAVTISYVPGIGRISSMGREKKTSKRACRWWEPRLPQLNNRRDTEWRENALNLYKCQFCTHSLKL